MIDKKLKAKVVRYIRQLFRQAESFKQAKELSVHPNIKGPRGGKMYQCAVCGDAYKATEIQVDHINPVVPDGFKQCNMTIDKYVERLFCEVNNLQVLCKQCHIVKSKEERDRKKYGI